MRLDAKVPGLHGMQRMLVGVTCFLLACAGNPLPGSPGNSHIDPEAPDTAAGANAAYRLGSGDLLRVIVFGEEDLSGEFEVDDTGAVSFPLIGQVSAEGRTLRSFEAAVGERLREGYLKDPRVSIQVLSYRPFYIIGQVEEPGEYPFVSGMNVLNAVALSGGFTPRANTKKALITRDGSEGAYPVTPQTLLEPGDMIRIPERFF